MRGPARSDASKLSTTRNAFAGPYSSSFIDNAPDDKSFLSLLQHVNCSYLSTPGRAPTLLELKQHAQSLTILIKNLSVSTAASCLVDNVNSDLQDAAVVNTDDDLAVDDIASSGFKGIQAFNPNEAFDWLNDLSTPYTNDAPHHNLPLDSLLNTIEPHPYDANHYRDICPLHHFTDPDADADASSQPLATTKGLLFHANEALEILDHQYSARGGLLSILPPKSQTVAREAAESTILGQMVVFMQRLVHRIHDIEIEYAKALDILAGEQYNPHQSLSRLGPDGKNGREMVYPQDRFVLANCGDDVWQFFNRQFEKQEKADEADRLEFLRAGVEGQRMWDRCKQGKEYARGITTLDFVTRFSRLKGQQQPQPGTIFVIPAHGEHPKFQETRRMEQQQLPVVVRPIKKPYWPPGKKRRAWESRHVQVSSTEAIQQNAERVQELERDNLVLDSEVEKKTHQLNEMRKELHEVMRQFEADPNQEKLANLQRAQRLNGLVDYMIKEHAKLQELKEEEEEFSHEVFKD